MYASLAAVVAKALALAAVSATGLGCFGVPKTSAARSPNLFHFATYLNEMNVKTSLIVHTSAWMGRWHS